MNTALGANGFIIRYHRLRLGRKKENVKGEIDGDSKRYQVV